ncbi:MAG: bactofilin family protein [Nitrospirota bacterium]
MFTRNTEKLESFVGTNSAFRGNIEAKGTLRIDGKLEGNVQADWVILGEKSSVKGDISARGIIVGGTVDGNLRAKEIIEIKAKGRVTGDTVTAKLTISEGGIFDGRSTMAREESKIVEFQSKG